MQRILFMVGLFAGSIILIALSACSEQAASNIQTASVKYALSADGLPEQGRWKSRPALVDINQDGFLDLAALPRLENGARVWLNDGAGNWIDASKGLEMTTSCGGGIEVGDINRDGLLDLAIGDHCSGVHVYLADAEGNWTPTTTELNPAIASEPRYANGDMNPYTGTEDLALGDVDEDGFLDIVATSSDEAGFTVYLGDGSGKNWQEVFDNGLPSAAAPGGDERKKQGWANELFLHDIDQDGHLDVVASYYAGPRVWRGDGKGRWQAFSEGLPSPTIGGLFRGIDTADINNDGHLDLAVANHVNGPEVFLNNGDGTWRRTPDVMPPMLGGATAVALGDFNDDGHIDLVTGGRLSRKPDSQYGLFMTFGDGQGNWTDIAKVDLPDTGMEVTWGIALGDVNNDKRLDFAVSSGGSMGKRRDGAEPVDKPLPKMQVWINKGA